MAKYEVEAYCEIQESIINAIDTLPKEQRYPTFRAIYNYKTYGAEMPNESDVFINHSMFRLAIGYKGVEVE